MLNRHHWRKFRTAPSVGCGSIAFVALPLMFCCCLGCSERPTADNLDAPRTTTMLGLTETKLQVEEDEILAPTASGESKGMLEAAGELWMKAKSGTGSTALGAKDWVQQKIGDAATAGGQSMGDAMGWANDTFETLKERGLTNADNTSQWLAQDWKNMQSWEYKTVTINPPAALSIDDQLNQLGTQGWECFHVDSGRFYFKKPSNSYLRHLPFRDVIKLIPLLQQTK